MSENHQIIRDMRKPNVENQQCGFQTDLTQTELYKLRWLEDGNFRIRKKRNCTIHVAKTMSLISFSVTRLMMLLESFYRVMVLDQGNIKEFESPDNLLKDELSIFYGMAKDAGLVS